MISNVLLKHKKYNWIQLLEQNSEHLAGYHILEMFRMEIL